MKKMNIIEDKWLKIKLVLIIMIMVPGVRAGAGDKMAAFPSPEPGMERFVLQLPEQKDESNIRIELIVGRTVRVDNSNTYFWGGEIKKQTVKGWGYSYYTVNRLGPMAGTMMAVDPDSPRVEKFITLGGKQVFIPYNSRLPVVVYVPSDVEVRYRLWTAEAEIQTIKKG